MRLLESILRQLGEDNFSYRAFLHELDMARVGFNQQQHSYEGPFAHLLFV